MAHDSTASARREDTSGTLNMLPDLENYHDSYNLKKHIDRHKNHFTPLCAWVATGYDTAKRYIIAMDL